MGSFGVVMISCLSVTGISSIIAGFFIGIYKLFKNQNLKSTMLHDIIFGVITYLVSLVLSFIFHLELFSTIKIDILISVIIASAIIYTNANYQRIFKEIREIIKTLPLLIITLMLCVVIIDYIVNTIYEPLISIPISIAINGTIFLIFLRVCMFIRK